MYSDYNEQSSCNGECKNGAKGCPYISCPKKKERNPQM